MRRKKMKNKYNIPEKVQDMFKSGDIEMVQLAARILQENVDKLEWKDAMDEYSKNQWRWDYKIKENDINVAEKESDISTFWPKSTGNISVYNNSVLSIIGATSAYPTGKISVYPNNTVSSLSSGLAHISAFATSAGVGYLSYRISAFPIKKLSAATTGLSAYTSHISITPQMHSAQMTSVISIHRTTPYLSGTSGSSLVLKKHDGSK